MLWEISKPLEVLRRSKLTRCRIESTKKKAKLTSNEARKKKKVIILILPHLIGADRDF